MERVADPALNAAGLVPTALRILVAGIFAYAGGLKIVEPAAFSEQLLNYRLLPAPLAGPLAHYVPWLELTCAAALFASPLRRGSWLLLVVLAIGFVVFTTSAYVRGLDISCGCFGAGQSAPIDLVTLARTASILALTLAGFTLDQRGERRSVSTTVS